MLYNIRTRQFVDCYYRRVGKNEVGEYIPPNWVFNFKNDFNKDCEVFSLETKEYPGIAQGIVALRVYKGEYRVQLVSAESSKENKLYRIGLERYGVNDFRIYKGVGNNLVAFACQYSLENGCDGYMHLTSKTETINFYTSNELGGEFFEEKSQLIIFDENIGQRLAKRYFPGGAIQWVK
ncbi:hypothetical protein EM808_19425 [Niallia taxi]|uniref:GNAT family N-acetyltransferase n=1 Tax=Niallia taxi TaxID=2499688 RepID=A0A3S2TVK6_9BACI|nr:hypothetical protein EM808_19425 [Niallia taxi]